jgi:hypothetical protein
MLMSKYLIVWQLRKDLASCLLWVMETLWPICQFDLGLQFSLSCILLPLIICTQPDYVYNSKASLYKVGCWATHLSCQNWRTLPAPTWYWHYISDLSMARIQSDWRWHLSIPPISTAVSVGDDAMRILFSWSLENISYIHPSLQSLVRGRICDSCVQTPVR